MRCSSILVVCVVFCIGACGAEHNSARPAGRPGALSPSQASALWLQSGATTVKGPHDNSPRMRVVAAIVDERLTVVDLPAAAVRRMFGAPSRTKYDGRTWVYTMSRRYPPDAHGDSCTRSFDIDIDEHGQVDGYSSHTELCPSWYALRR